jgi:hypothetical protein
MTTKFVMSRDINGYNGFGLKLTDTAYSATLLASTDTTLTVPSTIGLGQQGPATKAESIAIIVADPGTSVWVAVNTAASAPVGNTFASTSSQLNPGAIDVFGGDVLHLYTTGTGVNVSVRFYSLA